MQITIVFFCTISRNSCSFCGSNLSPTSLNEEASSLAAYFEAIVIGLVNFKNPFKIEPLLQILKLPCDGHYTWWACI
ncbi:MAG: hypothetical protein CMR00_00595 [[Chlorobium] sp. 445]|nr:MAG: hypothetical protein CMR00_00595 [[Chlorobium] sp. 445]